MVLDPPKAITPVPLPLIVTVGMRDMRHVLPVSASLALLLWWAPAALSAPIAVQQQYSLSAPVGVLPAAAAGGDLDAVMADPRQVRANPAGPGWCGWQFVAYRPSPMEKKWWGNIRDYQTRVCDATLTEFGGEVAAWLAVSTNVHRYGFAQFAVWALCGKVDECSAPWSLVPRLPTRFVLMATVHMKGLEAAS